MTVKIHTPTINEVTQAVYNLNATKHLMTWHEHILAGTKPLTDALQMWNFDPDAPRTAESLLDNYVEHNPLAHAPRPLDILDNPGDLVLDDVPMTVLHVCDKDGNPVEMESTIRPWVPMPFKLIPPDEGVYYMVKTEEIDGKKYSFFRPCHPSEKPTEGERLERYEKPLRLPPQGQIEEGVLTTLATAYGIRKELQEGSFEQPTVTQHGWGPANFQFKF
ncbi:hypothetical protein pETSU_100 [Edwardsiella phage pEt-SU]|uniref:Uncharacterized protein n=1 Tax=Edwardsiella phage pEt-SU TaxID=2562142 RepID=A0A4D6DWE6_9CAUD|nr:hypothetical protein HOV39_gp100 [Edwardsiella phage pEt-SU]QBZ70681.1 hypothetical protein pETSU_100 [Edwardsiella phage pEt-SU]